jgi:hypothetical protein
MGAGFTGLLSVFNILGRFFWSSSSDLLGRKTTYGIFFMLGLVLYAAVPAVGRTAAAAKPTPLAEWHAGATPPLAASRARLVALWLFVAIPMVWGLWPTLQQAAKLFG